jgi:predicted MFS family arabinose efflux permease
MRLKTLHSPAESARRDVYPARVSGAEPRSRPMRRFLLLLYPMFVVAMAVEGVVPPLLPTFRRDLGLTTFEASTLLGASWGVTFVLAIPIGVAADRLGARFVTLVGGGLIVVGALTQGFATTFGVLLAGRALFGVGLAIMWTAGVAWIAAQPGAGAGAIGGTAPPAALGFIIGPALGGVLADRFGTAVPFVVYGATAAVCTVALAAVRGADAGRGSRNESVVQTLRAGRREPLIAGAIAMVLASGLANGTTNLLVPIGLDEHGFSPARIGLVFAGMAGLFVVVSMLVARQGDALVRIRVAALGLLATAVVLVVPASSGATGALIAFVFLRVLLAWAPLATITYPLAVAGARTAVVSVGAIVGVVNVAWSLSSSLGPLGAGALADVAGPRATFAAVACAFALVAIILLAVDRRRRPAQRSDERVGARGCVEHG